MKWRNPSTWLSTGRLSAGTGLSFDIANPDILSESYDAEKIHARQAKGEQDLPNLILNL